MPIPKIEKQNAKEIALFQEKALEGLLQYLNHNSVFYRNHFKSNGINIEKIRCLSDLQQIPPTRKEDLQSRNDDFICVSRDNIIDYITT